jgi:hypothetical protein
MALERIDVTIDLSGQKIIYTTSGDIEVITDEVIKSRFIRDHKILDKQKPFVKVLNKKAMGPIGLC